jgi:hypothetical protein
VFFPWRWGGSSTQAWMPTYVSILRIPQMIWIWRATVEWYWQGKIEELGEKPVPVQLCPPQIPHGLTRARTRASAVRGRRLTTWAVKCYSGTCIYEHWVKAVPQHTYEGVRGREYIAPTHSRPRDLMRVGGERHAPAALYPRGKDPQYPLDRRLSGSQSRSWHRG